MNRFRNLILFSALLFLFCTLDAQIIKYTKIDSFTVDQLKAKWKKGKIPRAITPVKFAVDVYDVTYTTCWEEGCNVTATGLYFVPRNPKKPMPTLIYNHGTAVVPDRHLGYNGEDQICLLFAADGYAVVAPDYVGLGRGEKQHLYHHSESEANAAIDLLKASRTINEELGAKEGEMIFISGYSQGGHATMATHIKLQNEFSDEFPVTASSPMSGAYDLAVTQGQVMFQEYTQPHYLPYLLMGYNEFYKLWPKEDFFSIFVSPYDTLMPKYFDLKHNVGQINKALPKIPMNMLQPDLVHEFVNNPEFPFRKALEENNVYDWKPESPVQLCYCQGDEEVMWKNAIVAEAKMKENGAENVKLLHVGKKFNHRQCADFAVIQTKFFFDSFRKGSKKGRKGPAFKRMILGLGKAFW